MTITGIEVQGLPNVDKMTISDPYVRFKLLLPDGSAFATAQTGVVQNARDCKWDDTVKLAVPPDFREGTLSVRVWDDGTTRGDDDFIGRLDVPVALGSKTIKRATVDGHRGLDSFQLSFTYHATTAAAPSPPPSPPGVLPASAQGSRALPEAPLKPGKGDGKLSAGTIVPKQTGGALVQSASYHMRLQSYPQVLPNGVLPTKSRQELVNEVTWDDRTARQILWGAVREHSLLGALVSLLYGDGPRLPTVAQATQLLWSGLLMLLFLATVQLRYRWLGATWASDDATRANKTLNERLPTLSTVALASALVAYAGVLVLRWLFLAVNVLHRTGADDEKPIGAKGAANGTPAAPRESYLSKAMYAAAWSIVVGSSLGLAIGATSVSGTMDASVVERDVLVGWAVSVGCLWMLVEPPMLLLLAAVGLFLKWCTTFEDEPPPAQSASTVAAPAAPPPLHALPGPSHAPQLKGPGKTME
jgi:hypothetical protein